MKLNLIIALSLAAVAASQKFDNCTVSLNFPVDSRTARKAIDCVFPQLSHADCYKRQNSLAVAFKGTSSAGIQGEKTCYYDLSSNVPLSVADFLNIPAVCSMLGGEMAYATWNGCISPN
ncbi:hypothetical protein K457DRAFT_121077 [Linnemannia elongata AG-77]|uniref:Uncharacterized protein n=1 Tax=Linnemannia elongata AG-77 TaxID=1314771 RepID=A0A197KD38_9FUNG|nr:hypothetical protein K457DRAFT_121077 [Linnemannia elongata AG-77]